jgi:phosphoglycolate phosphatase
MNYKLLIFDWDGTLVDSIGHIVYSLQQSCLDVGYPVPEREKAAYVIGFSIMDALTYLCPDADKLTQQKLLERYRYHYIKGENQVFLFPSVLEQLQQFTQQGLTLAVATGKNRAGLNRALKHSDTAHFFATTKCADESDPKPSPTMVKEILEETGFKTSESLVIGDTTHDIQMAFHAGVDSLAVAQGAHSFDLLKASSALATLSSISQLPQWLETN